MSFFISSYIYIYIEREREREQYPSLLAHTCCQLNQKFPAFYDIRILFTKLMKSLLFFSSPKQTESSPIL